MTEPIVIENERIVDPPLRVDETPIDIRRWRKAVYRLASVHGLFVSITIHEVDLPGATTQLYAYSWALAVAGIQTAPSRDEHRLFHMCMVEVDHLRPVELTVSPKLAKLLKDEQETQATFGSSKRYGALMECGCWYNITPGSCVGESKDVCPIHGLTVMAKANVEEPNQNYVGKGHWEARGDEGCSRCGAPMNPDGRHCPCTTDHDHDPIGTT